MKRIIKLTYLISAVYKKQLKIVFLIRLTCTLVLSCKKNDDNLVVYSENNGISVSDDGYLKFDSQAKLNSLLEEYLTNENKVLVKSVTNKQTPAGFVSIAELGERLPRTKKAVEFEEATLDEFNIERSKALLKDPILWNILDTTLRLGIGDNLYKITDYGTFITKYGNEAELNSAIKSFEQIKNDFVVLDIEPQLVSLSPNVQFINSFKDANTSILATKEDLEWKEQPQAQVPSVEMSSWTSEYGLKSFKWESYRGIESILEWFRGRDIKRENRYPSNARVTLEVFDVNYAFYASSGVKVKVEKLKKFLFWTYWSDQSADKYAIGFDKFEAEGTWKQPPSRTYLLLGDKFNIFSGTFNKIYKEILYRGYHDMDFVKNFSNKIHSFVPKLEFNVLTADTEKILRNQAKDFVDYPPTVVYNWLKQQVNKTVWEPIKAELKNQIKSKSPMAMYVTWGNVTQAITRTYMTGVEEYSSGSSKIVRFDQSFGITLTINSGNISYAPFLPTTFHIKNIDMFGAAYFEGQWRGVRMYQ